MIDHISEFGKIPPNLSSRRSFYVCDHFKWLGLFLAFSSDHFRDHFSFFVVFLLQRSFYLQFLVNLLDFERFWTDQKVNHCAFCLFFLVFEGFWTRSEGKSHFVCKVHVLSKVKQYKLNLQKNKEFTPKGSRMRCGKTKWCWPDTRSLKLSDEPGWACWFGGKRIKNVK